MSTFTDSERAELTAIVARLREKHPSLRDDDRAAFQLVATDAQCSERGKNTRGHGVARDATAWAVIIGASLDAHGGRVAEYGEARFAFYLESLALLLRELDLQDRARRKVEVSRGAADVAEVDALTARRRLLRKLEAFAGRREAELAALADARGTTRDRAQIAASLQALVVLARDWLARTGPDAALAHNVGFDAAVIAMAEKARQTLVARGTAATAEGTTRAQDAPGVNRAEGRVLVEMEAAMASFDNGHEDDDRVPKLAPGTATRRALGKKSSADTDETPDATHETPDATHETPDATSETPGVTQKVPAPKREKVRAKRKRASSRSKR